MKKTIFIFILSCFIYFLNVFTEGSIKNYTNLGSELKSNPRQLYEWQIGNQAPFKYRVLFEWIVKGTWKLIPAENKTASFFYVYNFYIFLFLFLSGFTLFYLLQVIGFNQWLCYLGVIFYYFSPPVLMAFNLPVHTREDHLAFTILNLGLIFLIKQKISYFIIISSVAVTVRETLLILPFVFIFYSSYKSFIRRALLSFLPVATFILIRWIMGYESTDLFPGLRWNLTNLDQVVGFLYLSFGILWLPFFYYTFTGRNKFNANQKVLFFKRSSIVAFILIFTSSFLYGMINEIRLIFLLFPWVIILSLTFIANNKESIKSYLISKKFRNYFISLLIFISLFFYFFLNNYERFIKPSKYNVPIETWIVVTFISLFIFFSLVPGFINITTGKTDKNN